MQKGANLFADACSKIELFKEDAKWDTAPIVRDSYLEPEKLFGSANRF